MAHEQTPDAEVDRRTRPLTSASSAGPDSASMQGPSARFGGAVLQLPLSAAGARTLFLCLICVEIGFAGIHLVVQLTEEFIRWGPINPFFNLDAERSIPTWFSVIQLFVIGAVLLLMAANNRQQEILPNWLLLLGAAAFVLLSADESAVIHERITETVTRLQQEWVQFPGGYGDWIVPYLLLCLGVLLVLARPLARIVRNYPVEASIAVGGGVVIVSGAVGLEIVSYRLRDDKGFWYQLEVAGEEFLEMAGASMILYATLLLAIRAATSVRSADSDP